MPLFLFVWYIYVFNSPSISLSLSLSPFKMNEKNNNNNKKKLRIRINKPINQIKTLFTCTRTRSRSCKALHSPPSKRPSCSSSRSRRVRSPWLFRSSTPCRRLGRPSGSSSGRRGWIPGTARTWGHLKEEREGREGG